MTSRSIRAPDFPRRRSIFRRVKYITLERYYEHYFTAVRIRKRNIGTRRIARNLITERERKKKKTRLRAKRNPRSPIVLAKVIFFLGNVRIRDCLYIYIYCVHLTARESRRQRWRDGGLHDTAIAEIIKECTYEIADCVADCISTPTLSPPTPPVSQRLPYATKKTALM